MSDASEAPAWLPALLTEMFFNPCQIHVDFKRNERNGFCLDCCAGICQHCKTLHHSHHLLQIRRYVYQNVIKTDDAAMIDCTQIQTFTSNFAKVVFLKQRPPQKQPARDSGSICRSCDRAVQPPSLYCCISCKFKRAPTNLRNCEFPGLPCGSDEVQMTPDSVLEPAGSMRTESGSSSGGAAYLSSTEIVQRDRSDSLLGAGPGSDISPRHRRKGIPHRSPRH